LGRVLSPRGGLVCASEGGGWKVRGVVWGGGGGQVVGCGRGEAVAGRGAEGRGKSCEKGTP